MNAVLAAIAQIENITAEAAEEEYSAYLADIYDALDSGRDPQDIANDVVVEHRRRTASATASRRNGC